MDTPKWLWMIPIAAVVLIGIAAFVIVNGRGIESPATIPSVATPSAPTGPSTKASVAPVVAQRPTTMGSVRAAEKRSPVNISGAAWISRNSGSSDILRGLPVYILKLEATAPIAQEEMINALDRARQLLTESERKTDEYAQIASQEKVDVIYKLKLERANAQDRMSISIRERIKNIERGIEGLGNNLRINDAHNWMQHAGIEPTEVMMRIAKDVTVTSTRTNVDGKYSVTVSPGIYVLWAYMVSDTTALEWVETVFAFENITVDLFNDNADRIGNR